jgi:formate hydrogenlyase subunit 3/multisubunit Na+/H+ antiporter MnhD subunit
MVSKDQAIGGLIFIVCVVIAILYLVTLFYPAWLNGFDEKFTEKYDVRFWVIATPVFIAFVAVMAIGAWIGWTMATTPPPKPIEEITSEIEKKEETTPPTPEEPKPPEEAVEEKKVERKKKS